MSAFITIESTDEKELVQLNRFIQIAIESFRYNTATPYTQTKVNYRNKILYELEK